MSVNFYIAHVRRKNKKQPFFEVEESHYVRKFSELNALVNDEALEPFVQERNLFTWLSKVGRKDEPTQANISKTSEVIDSVQTVCRILERENYRLPCYYWVGFETANGILKSDTTYALIAGEPWVFYGGWSQCYAYPYKEGEKSQRFLDLTQLETIPTLECYAMTFPEGDSRAYQRSFRGEVPDKLYIEKMTYFDFYKPILEHVLEVCKQADDYIYIYVS